MSPTNYHVTAHYHVSTMSQPAATNIFPISNLATKLLYFFICWVYFYACHLKLSLILFFMSKKILKNYAFLSINFCLTTFFIIDILHFVIFDNYESCM